MEQSKASIIKLIKGYAEEKYDDYEIRQYLTAKERLNNEFARDVIDGLVKFLESTDEAVAVAEPKENEDVGTDGDGTVPAEAVHTSGKRSKEKVSEIHTGLSKA